MPRFMALQEDPVKLVVLGKDYAPCDIVTLNYLIDENSLYFLVSDAFKNLHMLTYNPSSTSEGVAFADACPLCFLFA